MKDLNVTEFRRQCLALLEDLPDEGIVITKHGQPLARVLPINTPRKGGPIELPLFRGKGKLGPRFPTNEFPYDLIFDTPAMKLPYAGTNPSVQTNYSFAAPRCLDIFAC